MARERRRSVGLGWSGMMERLDAGDACVCAERTPCGGCNTACWHTRIHDPWRSSRQCGVAPMSLGARRHSRETRRAAVRAVMATAWLPASRPTSLYGAFVHRPDPRPAPRKALPKALGQIHVSLAGVASSWCSTFAGSLVSARISPDCCPADAAKSVPAPKRSVEWRRRKPAERCSGCRGQSEANWVVSRVALERPYTGPSVGYEGSDRT